MSNLATTLNEIIHNEEVYMNVLIKYRLLKSFLKINLFDCKWV